MLGEKFGDYEIVRLIGRGGMGAVYEAMNANISRRAAIKVLLPEFAKEDDTVRRFFNEARAVNTINHPGVVQVSDVGKRPDGSLYLVMEFLEGETLNHWLGAGNPYLCGDTITLADYFGLAITTAGELVHCDLSAYPHVVAWLDRLKARPSYAEVYAAFNGFAASTKGGNFVRIAPASPAV